MGFTIPFFDQAKKSLRAPQSKYIVYAILICSLIGFVIQWPIGDALKHREMSLKGRELNQMESQTIEEQATLITIGVIIFLLGVFILNMSRIHKIIEKRRKHNLEDEEERNSRT